MKTEILAILPCCTFVFILILTWLRREEGEGSLDGPSSRDVGTLGYGFEYVDKLIHTHKLC
jgi:hypothetical protein